MATRHTPWTLTALLLALVLALPAPAALAEEDRDNIVAVSNTTDGSRAFAFTLQVLEEQEGAIDHVNYAEAYASCTDCQTVAIAVQVVLVAEADSVTPINLSRAFNDACTRCDTLATAYQFVVDGEELTDRGEGLVTSIEARVESLRNRGLTGAQIQAEVDRLMVELDRVLETEVEGDDDDGGERSKPRRSARKG